jgi:hypothetical protein
MLSVASFRKLFLLTASSFFIELLFSKTKNELPLVAVFSQEKMHFYFKWLSTSIRARNKKVDFS